MKSVVAPALALCVLASLSAGSAQAAGPIDSDVRCLAITERIAQNADPKAKETGRLGQVFFLGRVTGAPGGPPTSSALAASMVDAARALKGDFAKSEANRCSAIIKSAFALAETAGATANRSLQLAKPPAAR